MDKECTLAFILKTLKTFSIILICDYMFSWELVYAAICWCCQAELNKWDWKVARSLLYASKNWRSVVFLCKHDTIFRTFPFRNTLNITPFIPLYLCILMPIPNLIWVLSRFVLSTSLHRLLRHSDLGSHPTGLSQMVSRQFHAFKI